MAEHLSAIALNATACTVSNISSNVVNEMISKMSSQSRVHETPWYDFWSKCYEFDEMWTKDIDTMLMTYNFAIVGDTLIDSTNQYVPAPGSQSRVYYKYRHDCRSIIDYITFIKKRRMVENRESEYYVVVVSMRQTDTLTQALSMIHGISSNKIKILSFDTLPNQLPRLFQREIDIIEPKNCQISAMNHIIRAYIESPIKNAKVMIYGRHSYKSYTGILLKKELEDYYYNNHQLKPQVQVIDNYDPLDPGINLRTMIIPKITEEAPMILIISDIDTVYEEMAKNKLNNILDTMSATKNLIIIMTTKKNPKEMKNYRSFMCKQRVDFFLHYKKGKSVKYNKIKDIALYKKIEDNNTLTNPQSQ